MSIPIVTVKQGKLKGAVIQNILGSSSYYAFRGIPFATPPLENSDLKIRNQSSHGPVSKMFPKTFNITARSANHLHRIKSLAARIAFTSTSTRILWINRNRLCSTFTRVRL
uniref:Esterase A2 n=1 Tax=Apis cerana TaxID=7461 RepID=V9IL47_APICE